jgi:hypothetical protein
MVDRNHGLLSFHRSNTGLRHRCSDYEYTIEFNQPSLAIFAMIASPYVAITTHRYRIELAQTYH